MEKKRLPYLMVNAITYSRILMAFGVVAAASQGNYLLASEIVGVTLLVDKADGVLARATKTNTNIGAERDNIADMYLTSSIGISILLLANNIPLPELRPVLAVAGVLWLLPILLSDVPDEIKNLNRLRKDNSFLKPHIK